MDAERHRNEAGPAREASRGHRREPSFYRHGPRIVGLKPRPSESPIAPRRPNRGQPVGRRDGSNQERRRRSGRLRRHVEALVHPVDKVHVGDAWRPEHDAVAGRSAEPGMGGLIFGPDVRLDLDDPAGAQAAGGLLMDEARPDEGVSRLEGRRRE